MTPRSDLTRWNRAGLAQLAYVDGNAATFLEVVRAAMAARWSQWNALLVEGVSEVTEGPLSLDQDEIERLEYQYLHGLGGWTDTTAAGRDWLWEIARALARSVHVLTAHADAYANESFLRTASQWENVRRLVALVDYHPAPPASASTFLTIEAAEDADPKNIEAGFQVKYKPETGSAVIFETLEDIEIDPALNSLRPSEYDRNPNRLRGDTLTLDGEYEDIKRGEPVVLESVSRAGDSIELVALHVESVRTENAKTVLTVSPALPRRFVSGYTNVYAAPKENLQPLGPVADEVDANEPTPASGSGSMYPLRLKDAPSSLSAGDTIWVGRGEGAFRRVLRIDDKTLFLDAPVEDIDPDSDMVGVPVRVAVRRIYERATGTGAIRVGCLVAGDWAQRLSDWPTVARLDDEELLEYAATDASYHMPGATGEDVEEETVYPGYTVVGITSSQPVGWNPRYFYLAPPAGNYRIDTYLYTASGRVPTTLTTEESGEAAPGGLVVVSRGRQYAWARLADVRNDADSATTEFQVSSWSDRGGGRYWLSDTSVYTGFKVTARPDAAATNGQKLTGAQIPMDSVPSSLYVGRRASVTASDGAFAAFSTSIAAFDASSITLASDLPSGAIRANVVIAANVVQAGHGETQPQRILGSGEAAQRNQSFELEVTDVSFIADSAMTSGVRADVEAQVDGRNWTQVDSLASCGAADECYTVRVTEDGYALFEFGDGTNGRRLPTGTNNVRVTYRKGVGLAGNVEAGSLVKPVAPDSAMESISQPVDATGGSDREEASAMRESAPASVLTMGRAVSLRDFAALAGSHSSVWQAYARRQTSSSERSERVDVVVVPAGGGALGDLKGTLQAYLQDRCQPSVTVSVSEYEPVLVDLDITVSIDETAYEPRTVAEAVKTSLEDGLSLQNRKLGEPLYGSDVYRIVEAVTGVENSNCKLSTRGEPERIDYMSGDIVRVIRPGEDQVIYLDPDESQVVVTTTKFAL